MHLADTFRRSLERLTQSERGHIFTALVQYQEDPTHPGLSVHQLDRVVDPNFRSLRASSDLRVIFHLLQGQALFCYAGHHDDAYAWAARRRISTHPRTGAVVITETVEKTDRPTPPLSPTATPGLLAHYADDIVLRCGVTDEQLPLVRAVRDEETLLQLCMTLPGEVGERLLDLYGGVLPPSEPTEPIADPFTHPDTLRRFMAVTSRAELEAAFAERWEAWTVFLHPEQRKLIDRVYTGPARVAGSAGTGKTVVALHRAVAMAARFPDERVLLTTISPALAAALERKLNVLTVSQPRLREQIEVSALDTLVARIARQQQLPVAFPYSAAMLEKVVASIPLPNRRYTTTFVLHEWQQIVDPWQLRSWEEYRDFPRVGRMRRLRAEQRRELWDVLAQVTDHIKAAGVRTPAALYGSVAALLRETPSRYAAVIVDECQDLTPFQLRLVASLLHDRSAGLFFAGDSGQQIFQMPFSWKSVGIDIRGRSSLLKINYRTSHQIRRMADTLLATEIADVDGNPEGRNNTQSVFSGPVPHIHTAAGVIAEAEYVGSWIRQRIAHGIPAHEIAIIVRTETLTERARAAVEAAGAHGVVLDEKLAQRTDHVSLLTMALAKGLEYRSVAIMACDADVLPDMSRFDSDDTVELSAIDDAERQLLYVAMTRARDELLITAAGRSSEYLIDLERVAAKYP